MTLLPDRLKLTCWQGATFRTRLTVYTDDGVTLRNLTGYTAEMIIREEPKNPTVLMTLSSGLGTIVLGGTAGTIDLLISAADTAALTWQVGHYDLTITAPGPGDTDALVYGTISVSGV